jgi:hypothetical protein
VSSSVARCENDDPRMIPATPHMITPLYGCES